MPVAFPMSTSGLLRQSRWNGLFIILALMHGAVLLAMPSIALISIGLWWNANTISHNFIHRPFFRARALNTIFSWYLSLLLGFPQTIWRDRHLAHHAGQQKAEGSKQSAVSSQHREEGETVSCLLPPAFCLLPSATFEVALVLA